MVRVLRMEMPSAGRKRRGDAGGGRGDGEARD